MNTFQAPFRYYTILAMSFVVLLLSANVVGPKPLQFGSVIIPAGLCLFPLTYLVGGVLTEVYGFAASRQVIWMALLGNLFLAASCRLAIVLPSAEGWANQAAYEQTLGVSSRLMFISVFTYFIGEFVNAYLVSKLKLKMQGKRFWLRGLCGSWIGEGVETSLFIPLAFYDLPKDILLQLTGFYFSFKVIYAMIAMPFTQALVKLIKKKEKLDHFDYDTSFNPFKFLPFGSKAKILQA